MATLLGPLPPPIVARLRGMGYAIPPPRGAPTRTLEACLDGNLGCDKVSVLMSHNIVGYDMKHTNFVDDQWERTALSRRCRLVILPDGQPGSPTEGWGQRGVGVARQGDGRE